jgi:hypothetical protein
MSEHQDRAGISSSSSSSNGLLQNAAWRGAISSVLGQSVSNALNKVSQLAVEGANCLVAAAVESWHAETLRHFEHEVELLSERAELQNEKAADSTAAAVKCSSSSSSSKLDEDYRRQPQQQVRAEDGSDSSVAAAVAAAASRKLPAAYHQRQQQQEDNSSSSSKATEQPLSRLTCKQHCKTADDSPEAAAAAAEAAAAAAAAGCSTTAETLLGGFELLEAAPPDQLAAVRSRPPAPPLSPEELQSFMDDTGVLVDEAGFRDRVFQAGKP